MRTYYTYLHLVATSLLTLFLLLGTQGMRGEIKGDFNVSGGTYSFADNKLTITDGDVTVSTIQQTDQQILLKGGKLILNGVNISSTLPPIEVNGTAEIQLAENSTNTLKATSASAAGIHVPSGSQVTFTGKGTLTAENTIINGEYSCSSGIGGQQETYSCGTILFDLEGTITAKGGSRGAGIGTCMLMKATSSVSGFIRIKKGNITATGGMYAAGIGAGPDGGTGGNVTVLIEGGNVTATGTTYSGGIGSGYSTHTSVNVTLLGGTITGSIATGGGSPSPLNQVIIGPDVIVTGDITNQYTNGFVFAKNPKTATVKGNPTFPEEAQMTIGSGQTLTIPEGTTLTIEGTIANSGTITNSGTLEGTGAILGNIPTGWNGNDSYITYDLNGGGTAVATTYHKKETKISSFPETTGLTKEYYSCIGWNSDKNATVELNTYSVTEGENTLYAIWKLNVFTTTAKEATSTYGESYNFDLATTLSDGATTNYGNMTYSISNGALPTGLTGPGEGLISGTPTVVNETGTDVIFNIKAENNSEQTVTVTFKVNKKTLTVEGNNITKVYDGNTDITTEDPLKLEGIVNSDQVSLTSSHTLAYPDANVGESKSITVSNITLEGDKSGNYTVAAEATITGKIEPKELTITPNPDQCIYKDEEDFAITYSVSDAVGEETPAFEGKLSHTESKITIGDLKLTDNGAFIATNYDLRLSSPEVTITEITKTLAETYTAEAQKLAAAVGNAWSKQAITLTAPTDFKLKALSPLRSTEDWKDQLVIEKEGTYDFNYKLLRNDRPESSASGEQSLPIQIDRTAPTLKSDAPTISKRTATFTLTDALSGIASYSYQLDGANKGETAVSNTPKEHPFTISSTVGKHTLTLTAKDAAGNEVTLPAITFTLKADNPTPPIPPYDPEPDPEPDPDPAPEEPTVTTYVVTLPTLVGAVTTPAAGRHEVKKGDPFTFTLLLATDYDQSQPAVTVGEKTLEAAESGKYVIAEVGSDLSVVITGIEKNHPADNENIVAGKGRIYVARGILYIESPTAGEGLIVHLNGSPVRTLSLQAGTNRVEGLSAGFYLVKTPNDDFKKIVVTK